MMGILSNFGSLLGMVGESLLPPIKSHDAIHDQIINETWRLQNIKARGAVKKDATEIVGITDPIFAETSIKTDDTSKADDALTETIDFATMPDTANIRLYNGRGFNVYLTRAQIHGKPITRSRGANGQLCLDSLKRDDDIRKNDEIIKTISNDYIFDATQVTKIADYWYKRCGQKKHLYSLQVKGSALWYEPGEWYTLSLGGAGRNEYISATVECVSITVQHTNGGIGTTSLLVRECMESWAKTTLYTARLITGASPKRRPNQSNTLIVASSSFDGTYDYRCDGTADDVQIQAAIDYLSATFGGGTVQLTAGIYRLSEDTYLTVRNNIVLSGVGWNTRIIPNYTYGSSYCISLSQIGGAFVKDLFIDFDGGYVSAISVSNYSPEEENYIINVKFGNGIPFPNGTVYAVICGGDYQNAIIRECLIDDIIAYSGNTSVYGIYNSRGVYSNKINTLTGYGTGKGYGIYNSRKCSNNSVLSASTAKYGEAGVSQSYADASGTAGYECADTPAGGFNS